MGKQAKIYNLVKSIRLFEKKLQSGGPLFDNGRLPPKLRKQMQSIINQAKKIDQL